MIHDPNSPAGQDSRPRKHPYWACVTCGSVSKAARMEVCPRGHDAGFVALRTKGDAGEGRVVAGKYVLLARLGRGGFAEVYRAVHLKLRSMVAIKMLHEPPSAEHNNDVTLQRFLGEARHSAQLKHPNNIRVTDFGEEGGGNKGPLMAYIVMELLEGEPLSTLALPMPAERAVGLIAQATLALGEAHDLGIVHRDLKAANMMVGDVDGTDVLKVLDYGIAKRVDASMNLTRAGGFIGSPEYAAPEQIAGDGTVDPRIDVYSLGIVLFELLTGRTPFKGDDPLHVLYQHIHIPAPSVREWVDVPHWLSDVVQCCLAKSPDSRPQTMAELRDCLLHERRPKLRSASGNRAAVRDSQLLEDTFEPVPGAAYPRPAKAPTALPGPVLDTVTLDTEAVEVTEASSHSAVVNTVEQPMAPTDAALTEDVSDDRLNLSAPRWQRAGGLGILAVAALALVWFVSAQRAGTGGPIDVPAEQSATNTEAVESPEPTPPPATAGAEASASSARETGDETGGAEAVERLGEDSVERLEANVAEAEQNAAGAALVEGEALQQERDSDDAAQEAGATQTPRVAEPSARVENIAEVPEPHSSASSNTTAAEESTAARDALRRRLEGRVPSGAQPEANEEADDEESAREALRRRLGGE